MKKIAKKNIIVIFLLSMLFVACFLFTGCGEYNIYLPTEDNGYYISNYNINININENRVLQIEENIEVNFISGVSNGIYRYIPLQQTMGIYNSNGKLTKKNYSYKIENFEYIEENSTSGTSLLSSFTQNGYIFYQMGKWGNTEKECKYSFRYNYILGDDRIKNFDLFYFNIVGSGWDTDIKYLNFNITYPTNIEDYYQTENEILEFYIGKFGENTADNAITSSNEKIKFSIKENVISGQVKNLEYGEAVTIYQTFEKGYFKVDRSYIFDYVLIGLFVLTLTLTLIFIIKHRKKHLIVEVVEFTAPENITPAEAGYIIDQKVHGGDISALIVYWASKGYLSIKEENNKIYVTKLKDLPLNAQEHEKIFYSSLFANNVQTIDITSLKSFDPVVGSRITRSIKRKKNVYFNEKMQTFYKWISFLVFIVFAVGIFRIGIESHKILLAIGKLFIALVFLIALLKLPSIERNKFKYKKSKYILYKIINLCFILGSVIGLSFIGETYCDPFYSRYYFMLLPILLFLIFSTLEQFTEKGAFYLGKLLGLKKYIEVAEKDRIEMLVKEDPKLFYNVLPYAYVLGVSDVYMNKFKDIPLEKPEWITLGEGVLLWTLLTGLDRSLLLAGAMLAKYVSMNIATSLIKVALVVAVSRHSGGGFSGGGAGGGGGGRF